MPCYSANGCFDLPSNYAVNNFTNQAFTRSSNAKIDQWLVSIASIRGGKMD